MKFPMKKSAILLGCLTALSLGSRLQAARAGILDDISGAISSLRGQKTRKIDAAQGARSKAQSQADQVEFLHQRLLKTSRALDRANESYADSYRQMQSTERKIAATKTRAALVAQRFGQHKAQFGLRLASMQRHGQTNFLQVALGSMSLSDLSRRTAYFQALTRRDALLQERLKSDKAELVAAQNALMTQWKLRRDAQKQAARERTRIARGEAEQLQTWKQMSQARYALLSYALQQQKALGNIDGKIGHLQGRRSDIVAENQARQERIAAQEARQERIVARERALEEYQAQMKREREQMRAQNTFRSRVRRRIVRDYGRRNESRTASAPSSKSRSRYGSRSRSRYRSTRYTRRNSRSSIRYARNSPQFSSQFAPRVGLMPRYAPRIELAPMPIEALQNPAKFTLPMQ